MNVNKILVAALLLGGCQTPVDHPGAATIDFSLPEPGRVSLAVYDAGGGQVRTLLNAARREKGRHVVAWDGLDRDGKPLPAGDYTWKLLESQGLQAEYLMALGTSTGLNHWPGQHNGPVSVACDGESVMVGGAPEGSPLLASVGLDNTFRWNQGQFRAPEAATDLATDGDRLYVLESSAMVDVLRKATGARVMGTNQQAIAYRLTLPVRKLDPIAPTADESRKIEIPVGEALPYLSRSRQRERPGHNHQHSSIALFIRLVGGLPTSHLLRSLQRVRIQQTDKCLNKIAIKPHVPRPTRACFRSNPLLPPASRW